MSGSSSTMSTRMSGIGGCLRGGSGVPARLGARNIGIGRLVGGRQSHAEGAAAARRWLHPDPAAVLLDDPSTDVEAQAHARIGDALRIRGPIEPLEDAVVLRLRDAHAVVDDPQARLRPLAGQLD